MAPDDQDRRRRFANLAYVMCFVVSAAIITMFILFYSLANGSRRPGRTHSSICLTEDCMTHFHLLAEGINSSADPCEDFNGRVCGNVKWTYETAQDTERSMIRSWQEQGSRYLARRKFRYTATHKAATMYESCVKPRSNTNDVAKLLEFMREHHLPWPLWPDVATHPLSVVLDLLINFGVSFWFEMSLGLLPNRSRRSIYIRQARKSEYWLKRVQLVKAAHQHLTYARDFYRLYDSQVPNESWLIMHLHVENTVLKTLRNRWHASNRSVPSVRSFPLEEIGNFTPTVDKEEWRSFINTHLNMYQLLPTDDVLLNNADVLLNVNNLLQSFSYSQLLNHLGWWFVQLYSDLASPSALILMYGDGRTANQYQPLVCYDRVESRFRTLLLAERASMMIVDGRAAETDFFVQTLLNHTVIMLQNITWMTTTEVEEASNIVKATVVEPWTSITEMIHGTTDISREYRQFPSGRLSYLDYWKATAKKKLRRIMGYPLGDTLSHRHESGSPLIYYDYWWRSLFLHFGALNSPIFYQNAPWCISYGGFGALLARGFVRAFDSKVSVRLKKNDMPALECLVILHPTTLVWTSVWGERL